MAQELALSDRQLSTLRATTANGCNTSEFNLFIEYCRNIGLDPIRKQVIPLIFSAKDPNKRQLNIVVTIDGLRVLAERVGNYRPDEEEPRYTYNEALKDPATNPLGIEKCVVRVWKQDNRQEWHAVNGTAYWDEFAPVKQWGDKPAKLDGLWPKMPRIMITKCAESQALRKGWPDQFAGVHVDAEFDRAVTIDADASEVVDRYAEQQRLARIDGEKAILMFLDPAIGLERIKIGELADRVLEKAQQCTDLNQIVTLMAQNKDPLNDYWAASPNDALALKKELEAIEEKLSKSELQTA